MSEHVYIGACIYICVYMYIKDYISTSWDLELELGCHANLAGILCDFWGLNSHPHFWVAPQSHQILDSIVEEGAEKCKNHK
jgi:hypothetical protein